MTNSKQSLSVEEREDLELRFEAARIARNECSHWWHSLTDGHRRALKSGTLSMMDEAFQAGVLAALRSRSPLEDNRNV